MAQVVIAVAYNPSTSRDKDFEEMEFEEVNKYLKQGYTVKSVYPATHSAASQGGYIIGASVIFVLEKHEVF